MQLNNNQSFTLMELMIVMVTIGIIVGFSIPMYQRSFHYSHTREAINNLIMIRAASYAYRSQNGTFWPPPGSRSGGLLGVTDINDNLGLAITQTANGLGYLCLEGRLGAPAGEGVYDHAFSCIALRSGHYLIRITEDPVDIGTNPICRNAPDPTRYCPPGTY